MNEVEVGTLIQMIRALPDLIERLKSLADRIRNKGLPEDEVESWQGALGEVRSQVDKAMQFSYEVQVNHLAEQKRMQDLEEELHRRHAFESDLERYQLTKTSQGYFVYRLKEGREDGEPIHHICADCAQKGTKSLLHSRGKHALWCNSCEKAFQVSHNPANDPIDVIMDRERHRHGNV